MSRNPKILLAAPTSLNKSYVFMDWYLYASNLTYPNYDIYIVDNSHDENYHKELKRAGIDIDWVNPKGKKNVEYITESQNKIRDRFLSGDYEYLFSLEADIFPPRNVIEKLLSDKKEIVSVPYFIGYGEKSFLITQYLTQEDNSVLDALIPITPELIEQFQDYNGQVNQSYSNGIGCSLIHRNIIEKLKFRYSSEINLHSDTFFYLDIFKKLKKENFIDTSMIAVHHNSDWGIIYDHKK